MCIRDRLFGVMKPGATAWITEFGEMGKWPVLSTHLDHPEPVSYTHLRAHETVLDLVCRLLLEKKKQNKEEDQNSIKIRHVVSTCKINDAHIVYIGVLEMT